MCVEYEKLVVEVEVGMELWLVVEIGCADAMRCAVMHRVGCVNAS